MNGGDINWTSSGYIPTGEDLLSGKIHFRIINLIILTRI
jgi:hypothetical protein